MLSGTDLTAWQEFCKDSEWKKRDKAIALPEVQSLIEEYAMPVDQELIAEYRQKLSEKTYKDLLCEIYNYNDQFAELATLFRQMHNLHNEEYIKLYKQMEESCDTYKEALIKFTEESYRSHFNQFGVVLKYMSQETRQAFVDYALEVWSEE